MIEHFEIVSLRLRIQEYLDKCNGEDLKTIFDMLHDEGFIVGGTY